MTHTKANKSKVLALILGLTMCLALMLGIATVSPNTAYAEETDPRIPIRTITATSNVDDIIGYEKDVSVPTFNITEGSPAYFLNYGNNDRQRKNGTEWENYTDITFKEGTYRYYTQIRIDDTAGTTHVLDKNGITVTVNGVKWADNSTPVINNTYSFDWVASKEYEITKPTTVAITDELVPVTDLVKVFNGKAQEPTFGGTLVPKIDYEVSYATTASGELGSDGKPVGAGSYSVTVTGKGAYKGSFVKEFVIAKADGPGAPILIGYAPTTVGGSDGKITGTTKDMEYDVDSWFTNPKDCADGETTGLTEGVYFVRIKETANYKASATSQVEVRLYNVTVEDGAGTVVTKHRTGDTVTITVNKPMGKALDKWVYGGVTIPDVTKETITFEMPNCDVSLLAVFKDVEYSITVIYGSASAPTAIYQTEVTVTAKAPGDDEYFDKWEVTGLDTTGMDLTKTEIKFQMPANNVTFKATYLTIEKYEILVVDGTKDKSPVMAGETVTITANPAPSGKVFDKWTCETPGVTIEFASATSERTTFTMPAKDIEIKAHFRDVTAAPSVEVKVDGGTGAGTYTPGESVTITANEPAEGKVFKGWKDGSGNIVSTEKSYTFKVTEATTLTAVYEDAPVAKKGLSGGAIAGIVIGTVLLAGIGGFAIFWFAVKKKTFADLGVALKKGFTAIGNGIKTACRAIGNFFKSLGEKIKALFTKKK